MNIRDMHYDFKQKLNKIDSQQNRNLRVPEIDWKLNEAMDIFIKSIAEPRVNNHLGFEVNQRSIDDIRTLVINKEVLDITEVATGVYAADIPYEYMFYVSAKVKITKDNCPTRIARAIPKKHKDRHEEKSFNKSSYEWKEVNIHFYEDGIRIFTDETFEATELYLDYIRKPLYMHNAQDFLPGATYTLPNGRVLTKYQSCELPEHTHREIVDIAVLITTGDLQIPDYQIKQNKTNLNQII